MSSSLGEIFSKPALLIHDTRHLYLIPTICGHFYVAQQRCISDGGFAETTSYFLHGILYLFLGYALLHIVEQRNLLRIALWRELYGADSYRSNLCVPGIPLLKTAESGGSDF